MNRSLLSSVFLMRAWNRQWLHYNINILKMSGFTTCSGCAVRCSACIPDVTIITEIQSAHLITQTSFFYGHPCIDVANLPSWTGPIHSIVLLQGRHLLYPCCIFIRDATNGVFYENTQRRWIGYHHHAIYVNKV